MKIAIASDHAGFQAKVLIKEYLISENHDIHDFGTNTEQSVDFSDHVYPAALSLSKGECEAAILIDGAGYPSAALANMLFGVYAAVCNDPVSARLAREHSNTNALCLGGKIIGPETIKEIVHTWLTTPFLGGRYQRRIDKVKQIEEKHLRTNREEPLKSLTVQDIKEAIRSKTPLVINPDTIITPSVIEWVNEIR